MGLEKNCSIFDDYETKAGMAEIWDRSSLGELRQLVNDSLPAERVTWQRRQRGPEEGGIVGIILSFWALLFMHIGGPYSWPMPQF